MKTAAFSALLAFACSTACVAITRPHSGDFFFEKFGNTVVLTLPNQAKSNCVLATGLPATLTALESLEGRRITISYDIGPAPVFVPTEVNGVVMYDAPALFRGVSISRYCRSQQVYWIRAIESR